MKLLSGIVLGAVLALGGTYIYKTYFCPCNKAAPMGATTAEIGKEAPNFTLKNQDGETVTLADYKGNKTVVLEWFNKDCPFVKKFYEAGEMQRLQKEETAKDVAWLRVISSAPGKQGYLDEAAAKAQHAESNASHTLIDASGDVGRMYDAKTTPHMYVIDMGGKLVYAGAIDSIKSFDSADIPNAENYVLSALNSLRTGAPVATPQTTPYGCGVKY